MGRKRTSSDDVVESWLLAVGRSLARRSPDAVKVAVAEFGKRFAACFALANLHALDAFAAAARLTAELRRAGERLPKQARRRLERFTFFLLFIYGKSHRPGPAVRLE